jgi:hypothetical protein
MGGSPSLKDLAASRERPVHVGTALMPHLLVSAEEPEYSKVVEEQFSLAVVEHHLKVKQSLVID